MSNYPTRPPVEGGVKEQGKENWEILDPALKKVLSESAVWPPVQELGGGVGGGYGFGTCGATKRAKGGVTVDQVFRCIGDYFGRMVSLSVEGVCFFGFEGKTTD